MSRKIIKFGSVCSGIEAASVAWKNLDWQCEFVAEIEKFPSQVLKHHYPGVKNYGDITKFKEWDDHSIDVLIGGTPCQSFSVAGLRAGLRDPRGNLALTFLAIADRFRPRWLVWENVPGVHSSWTDETVRPPTEEEACLLRERGLDPGDYEYAEQRNDFDCFLAGMEELGYGVATAILDAQYFHLAQRRERVFVIGHLGGQWQRAATVLFDTSCLRWDSPPSRKARQGTATDAQGGAGGGRELGPTLSRGERGGGGLGTDAECDGGVIPIQEIGKRQSGTITNGVGHGKPGDPMFTLQSSAIHGIAVNGPNPVPEVAWALQERDSKGSDSSTKEGHLIPVCPTLRAGGNKTGGDRPPGTDVDTSDSLIPVTHALRGEGHDASEDGTGRGTPIVPCARRTAGNCGPFEQGDKVGAICTNTDPSEHIVSFHENQRGEVTVNDTAGSLKNGGGKPGQGYPAVCFEPGSIARDAGPRGESHLAPERRSEMGDNQPAVRNGMMVRRLTPTECERLQGFPDNYTNLPNYNPFTLQCPDGPRYKSLGNSFAVPCILWIGQRIELVDSIP